MTHLGQPDHIQARRRTILFTLAVVAVTLVTTVAFGRIVGDRARQETNRADNALVALEQACDQVARLGGRCSTPPSQVSDAPRTLSGLPGEPGPPGPAGPGPSQADIAAAVAAYLAEHPLAAGPRGEPGPVGTGCPLLGYHFEVLTVRLSGAGSKSRQILACVPDGT